MATLRNAKRNSPLKTGIPTSSVVLPSEHAAARDSLAADYYARFRPTRPEERVYVDTIIQAEWALLRLRRTESELYGYVHQESTAPDPEYPLGQPAARNPKVFSSLQWRFNAVRRARNQALSALRDLRENPIPAA